MKHKNYITNAVILILGIMFTGCSDEPTSDSSLSKQAKEVVENNLIQVSDVVADEEEPLVDEEGNEKRFDLGRFRDIYKFTDSAKDYYKSGINYWISLTKDGGRIFRVYTDPINLKELGWILGYEDIKNESEGYITSVYGSNKTDELISSEVIWAKQKFYSAVERTRVDYNPIFSSFGVYGIHMMTPEANKKAQFLISEIQKEFNKTHR